MKRLFSISLLLLLLAGFAIPAAAQSDIAQSNKELVRSAYAEYNAGNPEALYNLLPDEFMMNQGGATLEPMSMADVRGYDELLLAAMPDLQQVPDVLIAQGDWVVAQVTLSGTFTNPLFFGEELPPTNETVTWTEMDFFHFNANGQVIEIWTMSDPSVQFSQLGLFPMEEEEDDSSDTVLDLPAGYQTLSADDLAATFTSGNEERNVDLFKAQLVLGMDSSDDYTDTYVSWNSGMPVLHTASVQAQEDVAFTGMIATALPDNVVSPDVVVAEGDWVAVLVTVSGTFTEDTDFFGIPLTQTGQEVVWQLGIISRYNSDGKIVEEWTETDTTSLFVGLGLMPPMDEE